AAIPHQGDGFFRDRLQDLRHRPHATGAGDGQPRSQRGANDLRDCRYRPGRASNGAGNLAAAAEAAGRRAAGHQHVRIHGCGRGLPACTAAAHPVPARTGAAAGRLCRQFDGEFFPAAGIESVRRADRHPDRRSRDPGLPAAAAWPDESAGERRVSRIDWIVLRRIVGRIALTVLIFFGLIVLVESINGARYNYLQTLGGTQLAFLGLLAASAKWLLKGLPLLVLVGTVIGVIDLEARRE